MYYGTIQFRILICTIQCKFNFLVCFEHSNFSKVTASTAQSGQLRSRAYRRPKNEPIDAHQKRTGTPSSTMNFFFNFNF